MITLNQIVLRDLKSIDIYSLTRNANNKKIWNNMRNSFPYPFTIEDAVTLINSINSKISKTIKAIDFKGELIGVVSLHIKEDIFRFNGEIGYWIGEKYWGRGVGTKVVELMSIYGFEELGLNRIYAQVFEDNLASMIVLEKNGYKKEGTLRQAIFKNGQFLNNIIYAKLRYPI